MKKRFVAYVAILAPLLALALQYGMLQRPVDGVIRRDERNAGMGVRAHWRWYADPTVILYDVRAVGPDTSRIDVLRAFLQFAYAQKGTPVRRVDLAWRGQRRFTLAGRDFADLGRQYPWRSPAATGRVIAGLVFRLDGQPAFPPRGTGAAGRAAQQEADFAAFIDEWLSPR